MTTPRTIPISDPDDPRLAEFADLKDSARNADELAGRRNTFIAEGEFVLRTLASSSFEIRAVLACPSRLAAIGPILDALPADVPVYESPERTIQHLVGYQFHRGVLACGRRPADRCLTDVVRSARSLVILENLTNVDNIGGAFRNAAALAGPDTGVLLSPSCADPLYRKAIRVSMGHVFRVPFARIQPWPGGLAQLRDLGFTLIALTPAPGAVDLHDLKPGQIAKPALLLGAEGPGLSEEAFSHADMRVRIPIAQGVDSLNVSVAGAIALSHLARPT